MENLTEENIRIIFGIKVKKLRSDMRLSLQQLSQKSGISVSYLNEIENGKKYPKTDKINELSKALNTSYDQLVSLKLNKNLAPVGQFLNLAQIRIACHGNVQIGVFGRFRQLFYVGLVDRVQKHADPADEHQTRLIQPADFLA